MNKLFIAVDIGNSFTTVATFLNNKINHIESFKTSDDVEDRINAFLKNYKKGSHEVTSLISSVVPMYNFYVARAILEKTGVLPRIINDGLEVSIPNNVSVNPHEIGADLLADIVAVKVDYKLPAIIVDAGTVTKVLVVDAEGKFDGATFAPGLRISMNSMTNGTALLEAKEASFKDGVIGKDTLSCMLIGVTKQIVGGIKEVLSAYNLKEYSVVFTGGYGPEVKKYFSNKYPLDETLTLRGIKYIYEGKR